MDEWKVCGGGVIAGRSGGKVKKCRGRGRVGDGDVGVERKKEKVVVGK